MPAEFTLDTSEWSRAIGEYTAATGKTAAYSANRAVAVVLYYGQKVAPVAVDAEVRAIKDKPWFPKLVAKYLSQNRADRAERILARQMAKGKLDVTTKRGAALYNKRSKKLRSYTRDQAREYAMRIIGRRVGAINFIRAFFIKGSKGFKAFAKGQISDIGRYMQLHVGKFTELDVQIKHATPDDLSASLSVSSLYERARQSTADRTEKILQDALDAATPMAITDVHRYAVARLINDGRAFSAPMARAA